MGERVGKRDPPRRNPGSGRGVRGSTSAPKGENVEIPLPLYLQEKKGGDELLEAPS